MSDSDKASYSKALQLLESASDPPETPFKSKYEARAILESLLEHTQNQLHKALITHHIALSHIHSQDASTGVTLLTSSVVPILKSHAHIHESALALQQAYNSLAIVNVGWEEVGHALEVLLESERVYLLAKKAGIEPVDVLNESRPDISQQEEGNEGKGWKALEEGYTKTVYFLAQVYGLIQGKDEKSAEYCLLTLKRQLNGYGGAINRLTWSLDCMTLSQFYTERNAFDLGYQCLAAALRMLSSIPTPDVQDVEEVDTLKRSTADLHWIQGKFYLAIVKWIHDRDSDVINDLSTSFKDLMTTPLFPTTTLPQPNPSNSLHHQQPLPPPPPYTSPPPKTSHAATPYFLASQTSFTHATKYYSIPNGHVSEYTDIIQDQSRLYKSLAAFHEPATPKSALSLHEKRVTILESVAGTLNADKFGMLVKELVVEVANAKESIVDCVQLIPGSERDVNSAVQSAISAYKEVVRVYCGGETVPDEIGDEDDARAVFTAFVRMGVLWGKVCSGSGDVVSRSEDLRVVGLQKSLECYQIVNGYYIKHTVPQDFQDAVDFVRQMIPLLEKSLLALDKKPNI